MVPGWHKSFGDIIPFSINSPRRRRNKEANRLAGGAPTRGPGFLTWAAHWTHSRFLLLLPDIIFFKASQAFPMCTQMQPLLQALFLKHLLMRLPYLSSTILCWSRSSTCVLLLTAGNLVPVYVAFISAPSLAWKENSFTGNENSTVNKEKEHLWGMWIGGRLAFNFIFQK